MVSPSLGGGFKGRLVGSPRGNDATRFRPDRARILPARRATRISSYGTDPRATRCWLRHSSPARILSMVSTPRVEPMRQGVHLPQLSMAQNSMREARHPGHVDRIVEHDETAVADQAVDLGVGLVVEGRVEQRHAANRRRADRRPARRGPAARESVPPPMSLTISPSFRPKGASNRPAYLTLPAICSGIVPRERSMPNRVICGAAVGQNDRRGGHARAHC